MELVKQPENGSIVSEKNNPALHCLYNLKNGLKFLYVHIFCAFFPIINKSNKNNIGIKLNINNKILLNINVFQTC